MTMILNDSLRQWLPLAGIGILYLSKELFKTDDIYADATVAGLKLRWVDCVYAVHLADEPRLDGVLAALDVTGESKLPSGSLHAKRARAQNLLLRELVRIYTANKPADLSAVSRRLRRIQ